MLVARVTFTGSRFLLLSLLFARAYLSLIRSVLQVEREGGKEQATVRYVEKKKKNKSSPSLPYTLSTTTNAYPEKKRKLKKHLTNTVAKKKIPDLLPTSPFLLLLLAPLSLYVLLDG